jgi:flavin reductase (DIM6/NTAB) family NADH-FMN oxidoreductase RutF
VNVQTADQDTYRSFMSAFPTGVAVITTVDPDGEPRGCTCSSLSSVSLDPPILSVCLGRHSGTLAAVRAHRHFGVNLMGAGGRGVAELFARPPTPGQFDQVSWLPDGSAPVPRLTWGAIGFASCRAAATQTIGDHVVVFGEVELADSSGGVPLLYGVREFADWPGNPVRGGQVLTMTREDVVDGAR